MLKCWIFSKFTFISVVDLFVLFKVVSSSISVCAFSLPTFISNSFFNFDAWSPKFSFDMRFFSGYYSSHLRFNLKINPISLLRSSSAVVTSHLFWSCVYAYKVCFVWASSFEIASFLAMLFPWSVLSSLLCWLVETDFDLYFS